MPRLAPYAVRPGKGVEEPGSLGFFVNNEVTSTASGGGGSMRYLAVWQHGSTVLIGTGTEGATFDGRVPGQGHRMVQTGCGGLGINASGTPALGTRTDRQLPDDRRHRRPGGGSWAVAPAGAGSVFREAIR
jgi:hypothetical protein